MIDIVSAAKRQQFDTWLRQLKGQDNPYLDTENENLLPVGTRVRRGPDWDREDDDDCNGPGTVIGHAKSGNFVWVDWDNGDKIYKHRYGDGDCYAVLAVEERRSPSADGQLQVGCSVKPGKDAKDIHPELKPFERGVVIQVQEHIMGVKWTSGAKGEYDHIPGIREEVEYSPPDDMSVPATMPEKQEKSQRKNKNKNR